MSDEDVTNYLRMQVAAAANGHLAFLVQHPEAERREERLAAIQRQIEAALCGTDDEVHAARRASGGWKT